MLQNIVQKRGCCLLNLIQCSNTIISNSSRRPYKISTHRLTHHARVVQAVVGASCVATPSSTKRGSGGLTISSSVSFQA